MHFFEFKYFFHILVKLKKGVRSIHQKVEIKMGGGKPNLPTFFLENFLTKP